MCGLRKVYQDRPAVLRTRGGRTKGDDRTVHFQGSVFSAEVLATADGLAVRVWVSHYSDLERGVYNTVGDDPRRCGHEVVWVSPI